MNFIGGIPGVPNLSIGAYDGEGRLTQINASSAPTVVASGISYSPFGATSVTYSSGDYDTFGYDNVGHMTLYQTTDPNYGQYQGSLIWNQNGTLKSLSTVDTIPAGGSDPSTSVTYHYDDLARLIYASDGVNLSQTYSYDPYGNISTSGSPASWMPTYATPNTNQYQAVSTCGNSGAIGYDPDGNLLCDSFNTYTWNAKNKMTSVTSSENVTLRYDGQNRRVESSGEFGPTEYLYAPGLGPVASMNGQNTVEADLPLPGGGKAIYNPYSFEYGYTHTDWRGDVRLSTTQSGGQFDELSRVAYSPFGEQYNISCCEFWFDSTSGSVAVTNGYDMPNRTLHGVQGRWLNPDPAGTASVDPSNPQTWNRYAYVMNNPLSFIDPTGLACYPLEKQMFGSCAGFMNNGVSFLGNANEFDLSNVPVTISTYINGAYGLFQNFDSNQNPIFDTQNLPTYTMEQLIGGWQQVQIGTGSDLFGGNSSNGWFTGALNYLKTHPVTASINEIGAVQAMYQNSTKTFCISVGVGASVLPTKAVTVGVLNNGNMGNWKNVASGWGYSFGSNLFLGYEAMTNSAGTVGGPSASPGIGVSGSYTYGGCTTLP